MNALASLAGPSSAVFSRAAREAQRDPGPSLLLPALPSLLMAVAFTALFDRLNGVIDFPTGSFDEYLVPGLVVFVGLAGGGFTSAQLATDLRSGFIDRLRLHQHGALPLLLGRVGCEAARVIPGAIAVLGLGLALGGAATNGIVGVVVVVVLTMLLSAAYSGLFYVVATKTQDPQTPLNLQPIGIVLFFLSSAVVPPAAMPGWTEAVAELNPVTTIADGARAAMIGDLASAEVVAAFVVAVSLALVALAGSSLALTRKMATS